MQDEADANNWQMQPQDEAIKVLEKDIYVFLGFRVRRQVYTCRAGVSGGSNWAYNIQDAISCTVVTILLHREANMPSEPAAVAEE